MPWGFMQSGLIGGFLITSFVALLSYETSRILLLSQKNIFERTGEIKSYADITSDILGNPIWGQLVVLATIVSCLGGCVGYLIFLGEICGQLFDISFHYAIIFSIIPLSILSWIRSFRDLTLFTIIGVTSVIATIIYVIYDGQYGVHTRDSSLLVHESTPLFIHETILYFIGPATFLFTAHYCVLSMGAESLEDRIRKIYDKISPSISPLTTPHIINRDEELQAYIQHHHSNIGPRSRTNSHSNLSKSHSPIHHHTTTTTTTTTTSRSSHTQINIGHNHTLNTPSNLFNTPPYTHHTSNSNNHMNHTPNHHHSSLHILTSPQQQHQHHQQQQYHPINAHHAHIHLHHRTSTAIESLLRPVAVAYALCAILIIVHGSTGFILFRKNEYINDEGGGGGIKPGCEQHICQNIILNLSDTLIRDIIGYLLNIAIIVSYVMLLAPAREHIEAYLMKRMEPYHDTINMISRNTIRTSLVIFTAMIAICTPYFGTMLGRVGGFTDALQAFVLPPLIYIHMESNTLTIWQKTMYIGIFIWGSGTMIYTVINIMKAFLITST